MAEVKSTGRHTERDAPEKLSPKPAQGFYRNNLTRRNIELSQAMPARRSSSSLLSANVKSLRLFRHICRMLPFVLRVQQIQHRVTPVQSKIYAANWFRDNAHIKDLAQIDGLIKYGYETIYQAEMDYSNSGYLYRFLCPRGHKYRDWGVDRFYEQRADRINHGEKNSGFLEGFYRGNKSHVD